MKAITDAVGEKEMITQNMNWPMLVLRNDFAQQLQSKVCKEYLMRTYRYYHKPAEPIESRIRAAKSKIDTGLD